MHEFTSDGYFYVRGDRLVIPVCEKWRGTEDEWSPQCLTGQTVRIDGREFVVKAVEMFMMMANRDQPYRSNFALMVGAQ